MSKRTMGFSLALATMTVLGGGILTTAGPASAERTDCSISYLCLWGGSNYSGNPWFEKKAIGSYDTGWANNDESSSAANRSSIVSFMLYAREKQKTDEGVACLPRRYSERYMGDRGWGDRVSSMKITTGKCPDGVDYLGGPKD